MSLEHYIYEDGQIKAVGLYAWAAWLECADRHVASTFVGEVWVSTVMLGIDHNWGEGGAPVLFETMVFGLDAQVNEKECELGRIPDEEAAKYSQMLKEHGL